MNSSTRLAPPLRKGARVRVVTPSGPVTPTLLRTGIEQLESWGFDVEVDDHVFRRSDERGYLAGPDEVRIEAVQRAFDAPDLDAIVFSRGGYGAMRLVDHLDATGLTEHPKLVVGFSDITALHLWMATHDIASLHGPVVKSFRLHPDDEHPSLVHLRDAMMGRRTGGFAIDGLETVRPGEAEGRLLGGNLSLVASMVASDHCPDLNGAIVFLEDVGEEDYRLDRLFTSLRLARKCREPAGIVLGEFTECGGAYFDDDEIAGLVSELAAEFDCPVVRDAPIGHASRNHALPFGLGAHLDANAGILTFRHDAVTAPEETG